MRRRTTLLLPAGVLLLLTAGCQSGQIAATAGAVSSVDGARASAGSIELRDVQLEAPDEAGWETGADVELLFFAVNSDPTESDRLVSVTSSVFDGESGESLPVTIPPSSSVDFRDSADQRIELTGLSEQLYASVRVEVTFTFATAGEIQVSVPVGVPLDHTGEDKPTFDFHEGEESGSEG